MADGSDATSQVYFGDETHARATLTARGTRAAAALTGLGIVAGDVVAVVMRNEPAYLEVLAAIRSLGGQRLLIPWHSGPAEVGGVLAASAPRAVIVHADLLPPLWPVLDDGTDRLVVVVDTPAVLTRAYDLTADSVPVHPRVHHWQALVDAAPAGPPSPSPPVPVLTLTSGSTGRPKLVSWVGGPQSRQWAAARTAGRPPIRVSLVTAPLFHGAQFGVFMHASHAGADLVLLPKFDAEAFLQAVERHRVTHAYAVPTMFVRLLKLPASVRARYDLSSLNHVVHTGAPCPPEVKRQMIAWLGPVIWETYGCSETSAVASCSSAEWLKRPGSVGKPWAPVAIVDEHGQRLPAGHCGGIHIDVSAMGSGSDRNNGANRRWLDGRPYLAPGDVGYLDQEGYLYLVGRADGLINTGRVKVYPREIENELLRHPDVRDCAVFGVPDPEFGQVIGAAVDTSRATPSDLRRFLATRLSEHKIPAVLWKMPADLRLENGKLDARALTRLISTSGAVG